MRTEVVKGKQIFERCCDRIFLIADPVIKMTWLLSSIRLFYHFKYADICGSRISPQLHIYDSLSDFSQLCTAFLQVIPILDATLRCAAFRWIQRVQYELYLYFPSKRSLRLL